MTPDEHFQEKTAPKGSSLHYSLMSLPLPLRRAVIAVYTFRKQIVQIVDECPELSVAKAKEIETDGYRLLEHRISLTPLRKFWIAWWAVRREHYRYHFK
jgi:phytoene/squalene synthetase